MRSLAILAMVAFSMAVGAIEKGLQTGWPVDDDLRPLLTREVASKMREAGARWVRIHFRLNATHRQWDAELFSAYEEVVRNAESAGLEVLGLFTYESLEGTQAQWIENSAEVHGGNGDNRWLREFGREFGRVARRFPSVRHWEVWNEPNCWTEHPPGDKEKLPGGYYLYPSNFAWLLRHAYEAAQRLPRPPQVIAGGLLVGEFTEDLDQNLAAEYLRSVFRMGREHADWRTGAYPYDAWAVHFYIFGDGDFTVQEFSRYSSRFISLLAREDAVAARGPIWVTELGWATGPEGTTEERQARALETALRALQADRRYGPVIWFKFQDKPAANLFFGLLDREGNPKPSFESFQRFRD